MSAGANLRLAAPAQPRRRDARATDAAPAQKRLAKSLPTERTWTADREAMRAALRVVLDLPRVLPGPRDGGQR